MPLPLTQINLSLSSSSSPILNLLDTSVFELLNKTLKTMMLDLKLPFLTSLTEEMHVLPDFHGNRLTIINSQVFL